MTTRPAIPRRALLGGAGAALAALCAGRLGAAAAPRPAITVYKSPT